MPSHPYSLIDALVIARAFWGVDLPRLEVVYEKLERGVEAETNWTGRRPPYRETVLTINSRWMPESREHFINVIVHEYGHLVGEEHSEDDPTDVMYPFSDCRYVTSAGISPSP